jgi:hypothetical protein
MVLVSYSSLPYADGWAEIDVIANHINLGSFEWFWGQHNEHRFVIPKLFLAVDLRFFQAKQTFLLASIFTVQLLHLMALGWSMRALGRWRGDLWLTGFGLAAFCLFCPPQWFNFVLGFQINFALLSLFTTLSVIGLLLYWIRSTQESGSPRAVLYLGLSILSAWAASYCLVNGNLLWPLLLVASLLLRLRCSAVIALAACGVTSIVLYFHHYVSPTAHTNAISLMTAPANLLKFFVVYLGSVWMRAGNRMAGVIGIAASALAFYLVLRFRSYIREAQAFSIQLVLLLLFWLGTGIAIALGRLNFGASYAFSARYQGFALIFWCCLGLMLLGFVSGVKRTRNLLLAVQLCLLAVILRGAYLAHYPIREARLHGFQLNAASMALLTGAPDWDQLYQAGVKLNYLMTEVQYLRQGRLSIYSGNIYSQLGKPLDSVFNVTSPNECRGGVEAATVITDADTRSVRLTGWAWDKRDRRPPSEIVMSSNGVITGLGAVGDWRRVGQPINRWKTTHFVGFTGYVQDVQRFSPIKLYAILPDKPQSACYFGSSGAE